MKHLRDYLSSSRYRAIALCFTWLSILFGLWITRIPQVKEELHITDGMLGTALFFTPVGAMISMMLTTLLIRRRGEGPSVSIALVALGFCSLLPVITVNYVFLCFALFMLGFSMGLVDISVNAVVNTLEKSEDVKIMATSHAFYSLGGIISGVFGGILAQMGVPALPQMIVASLLLFSCILFLIHPRLKDIVDGKDDSASNKRFRMPDGAVWMLAITCFCVMFCEGSVADWSTVYMRDFLGESLLISGIAYASYSAAMTVSRFLGDELIKRINSSVVMAGGLLLALAGTFLVISAETIFALSGFVLLGIGYSQVIPLLFRFSAHTGDMNPAASLASVATIGYTGFLIGPVAIGWVAESWGLNNSFWLLSGLTLTALLMSLNFRKY